MMMSALQVHPAPPPPPPPALSPIASRGPSPQRVTLMLHNSEGESQGSSPPRRVPAFYSDESNNNNNNNIVVHRHVPLATPPLPQRSLPIPIPRSHNNINNHHSNNSSSCNNSLKSEISTKSFPASGQTDSVLKSLCLNRRPERGRFRLHRLRLSKVRPKRQTSSGDDFLDFLISNRLLNRFPNRSQAGSLLRRRPLLPKTPNVN